MNTSLTYKPLHRFRRPLRVGEMVIVRDRGHAKIGKAKIVATSRGRVWTDDGRVWHAINGAWFGVTSCPFPSIARR